MIKKRKIRRLKFKKRIIKIDFYKILLITFLAGLLFFIFFLKFFYLSPVLNETGSLYSFNFWQVIFHLTAKETLILENGDIQLNNNQVNMILTSNGYLDLSEGLNYPSKLSRVYLEDGSIKDSNSIIWLGGDRYQIEYNGINLKLILEIVPKNNYFIFKIDEIIDLTDDIKTIYILDIVPENFYVSPSNKELAVNVPEDELFLNVLPLDVNIVCGFSTVKYSCRAVREMGFEGGGVLITSPKSEYFDTLENIVLDNNLIDARLEDGEWLRKSENIRESYILFEVTSENYQDVLNYTKSGNFKQVLFISPLKAGKYNIPRNFDNIEDFYNMCDEFEAEGIKTGIHAFINLIDINEGSIDFSNPEIPLTEVLDSELIGYLNSDIDLNSQTIPIDNSLLNNKLFQFYKDENPLWTDTYLLENEIVSCPLNTEFELINCLRGQSLTTPSYHGTGTEISILPKAGNQFFIKPESSFSEISTDSFAEVVNRIDADFLYFDGYQAPASNLGYGSRMSLIHKKGVVPYLDKLNKVPLLAFGDTNGASFSWLYAARMATWDGPVFGAKEFTRDFKIQNVLNLNPYYAMVYELGWWKFYNYISSGAYDFDSVNFDDVHYVMTKVLALDSSLGLQFSSNYLANKRLESLFELIGLYHELKEKKIIPLNIKEYLKQPYNEAELNKVAGYNFVEKKVYKNYSVWDSAEDFSYDIHNPFENQKLKLEIRPRFDYYGFDYLDNTLIFDFSDSSSIQDNIKTSSSGVVCNINNEGIVSIVNNGGGVGGCKITIPGGYSLMNKRGLGFSIIGDNKDELILVRLRSDVFQIRDFKFLVDFNGEKEVILGEGVKGTYDYVDSVKTNWDSSEYQMQRHWIFNYGSDVNYVDVYINNIKPGISYSLQLKELKGLQEKTDGGLINPNITINGVSMVFPVELKIEGNDANYLEYDGNAESYSVYTSSYEFLDSGNLNSLEIKKGMNEIKINSNADDGELMRAEIIISVFDDSDGDKIPDNGNFDETYFPCDGSNNFCDDNCVNIFNPLQEDSDNDGIGNACDSSGGFNTPGFSSNGGGFITSVNLSGNGSINESNGSFFEENEEINNTEEIPKDYFGKKLYSLFRDFAKEHKWILIGFGIFVAILFVLTGIAIVIELIKRRKRRGYIF